jgi:hypothetical protein
MLLPLLVLAMLVVPIEVSPEQLFTFLLLSDMASRGALQNDVNCCNRQTQGVGGWVAMREAWGRKQQSLSGANIETLRLSSACVEWGEAEGGGVTGDTRCHSLSATQATAAAATAAAAADAVVA